MPSHCNRPRPVVNPSRRDGAESSTFSGSRYRRLVSMTPERTKRTTGFLNWMFRSRKTGRITLAQLPNWPLAVWLMASAVIWLGHPQGWARDVLVVLASATLALWAGDEVLRGVNPFRRLLGISVFAWLVVSVIRWLTT